MYFILLEQSASLKDAESLKLQASLAENRGNLPLAEQLWVRVLAVSRADWDAIEEIKRIAQRQKQPSTYPSSEPTISIPEPVIPICFDFATDETSKYKTYDFRCVAGI